MIGRALSALALALFASCGADAAPDEAGPRVVDLDALVAEIRAHRGRPLLVNFWAMWCPPCVAELPDLAAVAAEFTAGGGEVLLVALDPTAPGHDIDKVRGNIPRFLRGRGIALPSLLCSELDLTAITERLDLPGSLPSTLAFDRDGGRVAVHEGRATRAEFEELAAAAAR